MSLSPIEIPLGPWAPDLPHYGPPGSHLVAARNVAVRGGGYRSMRGFGGAPIGQVSGAATSAFSALSSIGVLEHFVATPGKFWWLAGSGQFVDATPIAVSLVDQDNYGPSWCQFGDRVIVSTLMDGMFYFDIGVSSRFQALPNAPKAKVVALVKDQVFAGHVGVGAGIEPWRVSWSGLNNSEIWGYDAANQADSQALDSSYGAVQAIIGGDYVTIFQSRAVVRATPVGGSVFFSFETIDRDRGAWAGRSAIRVGGIIRYLAQDGFYSFDGQSSQPIGVGRINDWVRERISADRRDQLRSAHDPDSAACVWCWPLAGTANNSVILRYFYNEDRWSYQDTTAPRGAVVMQGPASASVTGIDARDVTLESADILIDEQSTARDDQNLLAWDYDGATSRLYATSGPWLASELRTALVENDQQQRSIIAGARVTLDASDPSQIQLGVGASDAIASKPVGSLEVRATPNQNGFAGLRKEGRHFWGSVSTQEGTEFSLCRSISVLAGQTGKR